MKEQVTRQQHYVPQVYLKNFSISQDDLRVWVYDRQEKNYFRDHIKNICFEKYLYETPWEVTGHSFGKFVLPNAIEKDFSKYEGEYGTLLKRIISVCNEPKNRNALVGDRNDKRALAGLVINLLLRNPWSLSKAKLEVVPTDILKNEEIQSIRQLFQLLDWGDANPLITAASKKVWLDHKFVGGVPKQLIDELLKLNFSVLVSEKHQFVTSSFPVVYETYDSEDGTTHPRMMYLPIHPRFALLYSNNAVTKSYRNRMVLLPINEVNRMNRLYLKSDIRQARFIISNDKFVLEQLINE